MMCAKTFIVWSVALIVGTLAETEVIPETTNFLEICALMPRGTTILRPGSCTNWIKCPTSEDQLDFEEGSCLFGLYYNKDTGKCDMAENISCPFDSKPKGRCENQRNNTFMEDPETCTGYIFCQKGQEMHAECPSDLVFHPLKAACVYKQDYNCTKHALKPHLSPICHSVSNNVSFANDISCTTYHMCQKGVLATFHCDEDRAFDHLIGRCVVKENAVCVPTAVEPEPELTVCGTKENPKYGYFSDGESCSGYYICKKVAGGVDREPVFAKCPHGFFFDGDKLSCRDRLNVKCAYNRCEDMGNRYVNVAGDCSAYARCENNVATSTGKCPDKYYFDERTQGCTPQNISYAACLA